MTNIRDTDLTGAFKADHDEWRTCVSCGLRGIVDNESNWIRGASGWFCSRRCSDARQAALTGKLIDAASVINAIVLATDENDLADAVADAQEWLRKWDDDRLDMSGSLAWAIELIEGKGSP